MMAENQASRKSFKMQNFAKRNFLKIGLLKAFLRAINIAMTLCSVLSGLKVPQYSCKAR